MQIRRARTIHLQKEDNERLQIAYHAVVILAALCATQVLWLVLSFVRAPVVAVAVFVSAARVLMYWSSSTMLYVWLSIVTRQLTNVSSGESRCILLSSRNPLLATKSPPLRPLRFVCFQRHVIS